MPAERPQDIDQSRLRATPEQRRFNETPKPYLAGLEPHPFWRVVERSLTFSGMSREEAQQTFDAYKDRLRKLPPLDRRVLIENALQDDPLNVASKISGRNIDLNSVQRDQYHKMLNEYNEALKDES